MMLNILIADDNINLVELIFKQIIRKKKRFRLSDYNDNGKEALDSILKYHPDVIILNLEKFKINSRVIINYISVIKDEYFPYIIIISDDSGYINKIKNEKTFFININEDVTKILNKINIYLEQIYKEINKEQIYKKIKDELRKFKLNLSNKGTDYLVDSILLSYNKKNLNLTKDIYPVLSQKYDVTPMNIKWSMEKNIKSMRRYTENEIIENYFHIDSKSNLTIKTVIKTITENIEKTAYEKQFISY